MTETLQHHGVLGMKWGKSKAGKRAIASSTRRAAGSIEKKNMQKEANLAIQRKSEFHNRGKLTDAQLNKRVNRLQQEQRYKELVNQPFVDAARMRKEKRNKYIRNSAVIAGAVPFAMINPNIASGKYKVALTALKYGVPAVASVASGIAGVNQGKKKKH